MSVFVGIDPGLGLTSVTVLGRSRVPPSEFEVYNIQGKKLRGPERLDYLLEQMRITLFPTAATLVAVEGYSFGSQNAREAMGEWGGLLRWLLWKDGYRFIVVPPTTLKKFTTGKGNAKKDMMILEVFKKWGYSAQSNDDADSYALAQLAKAFHAGGGTKQFKKLASKLEVAHRVGAA